MYNPGLSQNGNYRPRWFSRSSTCCVTPSRCFICSLFKVLPLLVEGGGAYLLGKGIPFLVLKEGASVNWGMISPLTLGKGGLSHQEKAPFLFKAHKGAIWSCCARDIEEISVWWEANVAAAKARFVGWQCWMCTMSDGKQRLMSDVRRQVTPRLRWGLTIKDMYTLSDGEKRLV